MSIVPIYGLPGVRGLLTANHRTVFLQSGPLVNLAGGRQINGTLSRDPGNVGDEGKLRAGLIMGLITATGLYRPSFWGVSNLAYADNDTTIQIDLATATEIARAKVAGGGGNLSGFFIGPPAAAGVVASTAITITAVTLNGATSTITTGDLNLNKVAGSFIGPADGAQVPKIMLPDGYPISAVDGSGNSINVPFPFMPVWAIVESTKLLPAWPADASLQAYLTDNLSTLAGGKYSFSHKY